MKKMKLVNALALVVLGTGIAYSASQPVFAEENQVVTQSDAETVQQEKEKLDELKDKVAGTSYEDVIDQLLPVLDNIEHDVSLPEKSARFNPVTIYDLDSIGARLELIVEIGNAIAFSIEQLDNKVEQAHRELGVEIAHAIIKVADPFASTQEIKNQIASLQKVIATVINYPDLDLNAKATAIVKQKLSDAIWHTRFERDKKVLGKVPFAVYNDLNKVITKAVGVQLGIRTTVGDVNNAIKSLEEALAFAISQAK
ncbi:CAMP factor family pore-forming toxin [Enterococcus sp. BWR-S5]|uniref:CAMP factor family pore-forming toxin n=1 Tax=Enterococcus sp. BWR-S5 TaxID=2787714 RepID=UPI001924391B|nr:CAMP factor family pore-forming toxin [Enterococcus sp. BWR-S5]MBL1225769.1 CAMP factor family pore-forming toxin [Enterococcus sp. BWR-S5]